ncbi:hypothetical protein GA0074692_0058 [Micromonospora pallida]|uniref:Uncharacterized protein n=1 Tax=Micromonospora pallida TaxID=145854 RepID=A0A1C6RIV4_9ACTN|nr:hypothetical protein [Micromonospora pallida]SCL16972.1 hypothetical protein GA0074692_0058 [Micromonospora pallida]
MMAVALAVPWSSSPCSPVCSGRRPGPPRRAAENRELRAEVVALRRAAIRSTAAALLTPDDIAAIETYANTHREDGPR